MRVSVGMRPRNTSESRSFFGVTYSASWLTTGSRMMKLRIRSVHPLSLWINPGACTGPFREAFSAIQIVASTAYFGFTKRVRATPVALPTTKMARMSQR